MDTRIQGMKTFLDAARSVYHAVAEIVKELEKAGYTRLQEADNWQIVPGGKYFLTRGGSAVMAFRIPQGTPNGFLMSASHADWPCFKLKENGELTGKYTKLATERYGGMIMSTWMDRPLSVAGRALVETEDGVQTRLVDIDQDLLLIPTLGIHMNPKANDGYSWNPAVDTLPVLGGPDAAGKLDAFVEEKAGGKVLGKDLYLYIRQQASIWGIDQEYLSSHGLDDLGCVWCCTQGFLNGEESASVPVLCVFDTEEVGSSSVQGAASTLLEDTLRRICCSCGWELDRMLRQSFMISADNGHAIHPNHPEFADANNAPMLNRGVVLKFNAAQKYTTDGVSAAIFRKVCQKAQVPVQTYYNRADLRGGGTLGYISLSHVSVPTADIGLPQLAMHSSFETAGVKDAGFMMDALAAYYSSTLQCPADGQYIFK